MYSLSPSSLPGHNAHYCCCAHKLCVKKTARERPSTRCYTRTLHLLYYYIYTRVYNDRSRCVEGMCRPPTVLYLLLASIHLLLNRILHTPFPPCTTIYVLLWTTIHTYIYRSCALFYWVYSAFFAFFLMLIIDGLFADDSPLRAQSERVWLVISFTFYKIFQVLLNFWPPFPQWLFPPKHAYIVYVQSPLRNLHYRATILYNTQTR